MTLTGPADWLLPPSFGVICAVTGSDVIEEDCTGDVANIDAAIQSRQTLHR